MRYKGSSSKGWKKKGRIYRNLVSNPKIGVVLSFFAEDY